MNDKTNKDHKLKLTYKTLTVGTIGLIMGCCGLLMAVSATDDRVGNQRDIATVEVQKQNETDEEIDITEVDEVVEAHPTNTPTLTDTPESTSAPLPTGTPSPLAPPFMEIRSNMESMTKAQWKAYLPTLDGTQAENWTGWVADVNDKGGGRYELWIDMDSPDEILSVQDIYFPIPADIALQLQKGQEVTFSGQIDRASDLLGSLSIHLKNATLENITVESQDNISDMTDTTSDEIAPSYEEIRSNVDSMTEAQWKAYLPTLEGLMVENWSGWVADVDVKGNKYELQIDMDSPDTLFSTYDIRFPIPDDIALEIQKDENITFSGRIKSITELLGSVSFELEDVTIQRD